VIAALCEKFMMRSTFIAFVIGFLVYAFIPIAMDRAYMSDSTVEPLWGLQFSILWGGVGGIAFVVSWFCILGLWFISKNLMDKHNS
jgi:Na+/H+ antiporter NhaC